MFSSGFHRMLRPMTAVTLYVYNAVLLVKHSYLTSLFGSRMEYSMPTDASLTL